MVKKLNSYALSVIGKKSLENEDNFVLPKPDKKFDLKKIDLRKQGSLYAVCDGMGGQNAGEVASELCANWLKKDYYKNTGIDDIPTWFDNEIAQLNNKLYKLSQEHDEYAGMGTTLVSLLIKNGTAYINNVGDSRLYLFDFDNHTFKQITEDHSEVWELYREGYIEKDDIISNPRKHILTQALGTEKNIKINSYSLKLPQKYLFLLCSDGLTDVMTDNAILDTIGKADNLQKKAKSLYDLSQEMKSKDDVTILLVSNSNPKKIVKVVEKAKMKKV